MSKKQFKKYKKNLRRLVKTLLPFMIIVVGCGIAIANLNMMVEILGYEEPLENWMPDL